MATRQRRLTAAMEAITFDFTDENMAFPCVFGRLLSEDYNQKWALFGSGCVLAATLADKKGAFMLRLFGVFSLVFLLNFTGCSIKQINENVDSITGDITSAFEGSRDKSAD